MLSNLHESHDWDIMGHAYEQYAYHWLQMCKNVHIDNLFRWEETVRVCSASLFSTCRLAS